MRPLVLLAGGMLTAGAMGIAQAQTLNEPAAAALLQGPIDLPTSGLDVHQQQARLGPDLITRTVTKVSRQAGPRAVDTLRLTAAQSGLTAAGYVTALRDPGLIGAAAYELDYRRTWPGAVSRSAGGYRFDLTPQAGVAYGGAGGSIGGGAILSLSRDARIMERLERLGVEDGARYGDQGRWYLFAAASGRAVGLNLAPGLDGGWSTDPQALVGDAQVGLGWRRGDTQTSLGYVIRRVRVEDRFAREAFDIPSSDQVVGLSFSFKPRR